MSVKSGKIILVTAFLLSISPRLSAPNQESLVIARSDPFNPYLELIYAIGTVETERDTAAYNPVEEAVGYFQIRPIKLKDYNIRTGSNYKMNDLYNYEISKKIFLYYADQIGPYDFEKIAKRWNGSGKMTIHYWKRVRKHLS